MTSRKLTLLRALYAAGLGLLLLAFFLLVPEAERDAAALLDLAVVALVFTINFPLGTFGWATGQPRQFEPAHFAIRQFGTGTYTVLALAGVAFGLLGRPSFNVQLVYQLAFLLLAAGAAIVSRLSHDQVGAVVNEQRDQGASLAALRAALRDAEQSFTLPGLDWDPQLRTVQALKEHARYLSPARGPAERQQESELIAELTAIRAAAATGREVGLPQVEPKLQRCAALMALRRQPNIRHEEVP